MTSFFFLLAGIFFGISTHGGEWLFAILAGVISAVFGWINRPRREGAPSVARTGTLLALGAVAPPPPTAPSFVDPQAWSTQERASDKKKKSWTDLEAELDTHLYSSLHMLRSLIPHVHSASIFYPGPPVPRSLQLHCFDSLAGETIEPGAVVLEGQGLLGYLWKGDHRNILEGDLSGARLYYYKDQPEIRSFAAVPIILEGKMNGAVVLDSLEPNAFSEETISHLIAFSRLICELSLQTATNLLHMNEREQYKELFEYQKKFMNNMSIDDIFRSIAAFIDKYIPNDRTMILLADDDEPPKRARVAYATGRGADQFEGLEMELDGKGLLSLCFMDGKELHRSFKPGERVFRVVDTEPTEPEFTALVALPVLEDQHTSVRMVVCVESMRRESYSEHFLNLIHNICNSAGFALTRVRAYQEKQTLASRDGLTGLLNHRAFRERLRIETMRAKRLGTTVGLMMTDVDKFKSVNDTYGHPVGDQVLKMISKQISSAIREEVDLVARYGGEEFVVMITAATDQVVMETAERIRTAIEATEIDIGQANKLRVTISIGYALYPDHSEDVNSVLDKADKALYKAKESGRNRVVAFH